MSTLEGVLAALDTGEPTWVGLAAGGWLVALLVALLAIWQAARADGVTLRAAEAAHELRGPLCAARLALSSLQRDLPDAPPVGRRVAAVDLELARAGLALDELAGVGVGRGGRCHPDRDAVDLAALARAAEPAWQALADAHDTTLDVCAAHGPVMVLGDSRRLLQGLENLLANACEHGRGPVRVSVVATAQGARVEVSDAGAGPSPRALRRARRRARGRIASRAGASSPRGHGMAIAARLARDSGGRLRARGAIVALEIPFERPRRLRAAARRLGAASWLIGPLRWPRGARAGHQRVEPAFREPLAGAR